MMFCSSYIPLFLLIMVKNFFERISCGIEFKEFKFNEIILFNQLNDYFFCILLIITISSGIYLSVILKRSKESNPLDFHLVQVKNETSEYFLNYISIYLLSCIGLSINSITDMAVFVIIMIIVGYIYIENNLIYINPTANFMGYKIYTATVYRDKAENSFECLLIAHRDIKLKNDITILGLHNETFMFVQKIYQTETQK